VCGSGLPAGWRTALVDLGSAPASRAARTTATEPAWAATSSASLGSNVGAVARADCVSAHAAGAWQRARARACVAARVLLVRSSATVRCRRCAAVCAAAALPLRARSRIRRAPLLRELLRLLRLQQRLHAASCSRKRQRWCSPARLTLHRRRQLAGWRVMQHVPLLALVQHDRLHARRGVAVAVHDNNLRGPVSRHGRAGPRPVIRLWRRFAARGAHALVVLQPAQQLQQRAVAAGGPQLLNRLPRAARRASAPGRAAALRRALRRRARARARTHTRLLEPRVQVQALQHAAAGAAVGARVLREARRAHGLRVRPQQRRQLCHVTGLLQRLQLRNLRRAQAAAARGAARRAGGAYAAWSHRGCAVRRRALRAADSVWRGGTRAAQRAREARAGEAPPACAPSAQRHVTISPRPLPARRTAHPLLPHPASARLPARRARRRAAPPWRARR
jgi:hypothetical protein